MSEAPVVVASAVSLPDPETVEKDPSIDGATKRRQSSVSEQSSKRPRLGQASGDDENAIRKPSLPTPDRSTERRRSGQIEERKRGQRLFGALLGTLSQSSSSTAQKRRVDIEKKQQAKLKLQADEFDEKRKQRLEALMEVRRQEQKKYNEQSMRIRHSNLRATANFLQTKVEPKLYYKPWDLLPGDEANIKAQIEEAEAIIDNETEEARAEHTNHRDDPMEETNDSLIKPTDAAVETMETVGETTNATEASEIPANNDTNAVPTIPTTPQAEAAIPEASKDDRDDSGDIVLEADEDTVIY